MSLPETRRRLVAWVTKEHLDADVDVRQPRVRLCLGMAEEDLSTGKLVVKRSLLVLEQHEVLSLGLFEDDSWDPIIPPEMQMEAMMNQNRPFPVKLRLIGVEDE